MMLCNLHFFLRATRHDAVYLCLSAHVSLWGVQGQEEIAAGALLLKERAKALAAGRKEDNWKGQLRDLFKLFDVEQRGALDEDQLAMLLKVCIHHQCVCSRPPPSSPTPPFPD